MESEIPIEELILKKDQVAEQESIKAAINFFEAAGNKERFSILNLLKNREYNVEDSADADVPGIGESFLATRQLFVSSLDLAAPRPTQSAELKCSPSRPRKSNWPV